MQDIALETTILVPRDAFLRDVTKMAVFDVRVVCKQPRCQVARLFRM
jgi:hypothetical protein